MHLTIRCSVPNLSKDGLLCCRLTLKSLNIRRLHHDRHKQNLPRRQRLSWQAPSLCWKALLLFTPCLALSTLACAAALLTNGTLCSEALPHSQTGHCGVCCNLIDKQSRCGVSFNPIHKQFAVMWAVTPCTNSAGEQHIGLPLASPLGSTRCPNLHACISALYGPWKASKVSSFDTCRASLLQHLPESRACKALSSHRGCVSAGPMPLPPPPLLPSRPSPLSPLPPHKIAPNCYLCEDRIIQVVCFDQLSQLVCLYLRSSPTPQ